MDAFWKAAAVTLLAVILGLTVGKQEKDISVLLVMAVCCIVGTITISYLKPVMDLLWELEAIGNLQNGIFTILLKVVGISLIAEMTGMICSDAGNSSLGKSMQMLSLAVVLYLSVPVFKSLLTIIREILGNL